MQTYLHESTPEPLIVFISVIALLVAFKVIHILQTRKKVHTLFATLDLIAEERKLKNKLMKLSDYDGIDRRKIIPSSFLEHNFTEIDQLDLRTARITELARDIAENLELGLEPLEKAELLNAENKVQEARLQLRKVS